MKTIAIILLVLTAVVLECKGQQPEGDSLEYRLNALAAKDAQARESSSNQWAPPEEVCCRDNKYCVQMIPKAGHPDQCTLRVSSNGRILAEFPTMGYLLDVFYSADNRYVAINNRRANAGDYLWVISLLDGQPLKIPEDVATELGKKELGQISGDHFPRDQAMPEVTALCPDCTPDNLNHPFLFSRDWKSSDELNVVEEFHFFGKGAYGPGASGVWIAVHKVCRVTGKGLSLVKRSIEKETQPSELVKRAWTFAPFYVPEDHKNAVELYEKAAEQGDVHAQIALAEMYFQGRGVSKGEKKAAELYEKAAAQGDPNAQTNLGWMYHEGRGVPRDDQKAVELYQKAADQGYAVGQAYLASQYAQGKGVPLDYRKAVELFQQAVAAGPSPNAYNDFAWFLATCPDRSHRNGKQAVEYATKACEITQWKVRNFVGTLAAAYAELGDFDKAINYEKEAIALQGDYPTEAEMKRSLALYEQHKPFRTKVGR